MDQKGIAKIGSLAAYALKRLLSKTPRAYKTVADVSLGISIATGLLSLVPLNIPLWIITVGTLITHLAAQMQVEPKTDEKKE